MGIRFRLTIWSRGQNGIIQISLYANFIHVDFYDNPQGIQGDLNNAVLSPTILEWNLPSTEWSFVIDQQGLISARFESFATFEEIEEALLELL